jgi:hypothetical protein
MSSGHHIIIIEDAIGLKIGVCVLRENVLDFVPAFPE